MNRLPLELTTSGQDLLDAQPEVFEAFGDLVNTAEGQKRLDPGQGELIGQGVLGDVYVLPGHPEYVTKVTTAKTGGNWPSILKCMGRWSMPTELKFSHTLQSYLEQSGNPAAVYAPHSYALQRFSGGSALLMERLPASKNMIGVHNEINVDNDDYEIYEALHRRVAIRIMTALLETPLMDATNDIMTKNGRGLSEQNIHIEPPYIDAKSPIWLIDSFGSDIFSILRAKARLKDHRFIFNT